MSSNIERRKIYTQLGTLPSSLSATLQLLPSSLSATLQLPYKFSSLAELGYSTGTFSSVRTMPPKKHAAAVAAPAVVGKVVKKPRRLKKDGKPFKKANRKSFDVYIYRVF